MTSSLIQSQKIYSLTIWIFHAFFIFSLENTSASSLPQLLQFLFQPTQMEMTKESFKSKPTLAGDLSPRRGQVKIRIFKIIFYSLAALACFPASRRRVEAEPASSDADVPSSGLTDDLNGVFRRRTAERGRCWDWTENTYVFGGQGFDTLYPLFLWFFNFCNNLEGSEIPLYNSPWILWSDPMSKKKILLFV